MNIKIRNLFILISAIAAVSCTDNNSPAWEVDPFIGTALDGHTSPAASAPFGLVQLGPDTVDGGVAGYHDKDSLILGFSHTHLSGTGQGDLGDFLFVPVIGEVPQDEDGFAVQPLPFSHKDEKASAGYYRVRFPSLGIVAEMTALSHTGCHRYTFSAKAENAANAASDIAMVFNLAFIMSGTLPFLLL